jgi:hypothetical protein
MDRRRKKQDHHKGSKTQRTARAFDRIYKIGKMRSFSGIPWELWESWEV